MGFRSIRARITIVFLGILVVGLLIISIAITQIELWNRETAQWLIGFGVFMGLLVFLAASFVASRIVGPIDNLTNEVNQMAEGDLSRRLHSHTNDEVGELTQAFDALASKLDHQIAAYLAEEDKLQAMLGQMSDGVIIADEAGNVSLMNTAAQELFDLKEKHALGRSIVQVIRHHQLVELWRESVDSGEEQVSSYEMPQSRRFLQVIVTPLSISLQNNSLLLFQDFTDVRRLETVRRDFISNISHELRTPLASLKALAETLQSGALDDRLIAERFLGQIETEVDALTLMVNELLELSRIESGRVPLQLAAENACEILQNVEERMHLQAKRAGVRMDLDCPADVPEIMVDRPRLEQVLVNLVHNAVKFSDQDSTVYLRIENKKRGVRFTVQDSGIGIPAADLPRVFERFYKTDRARASGGTGLGLAIAKHLVEAHGGEIWAKSSEGEGSSFFFTIPLQS
ncbi:MAG: sensor histidine kinase [Chloroflexi bacterium]|nr:MAG: sensor histidine kinase [Chloroflexota bacterium]MBL1193761.1 sensor histidine kinase [Chloroflexota bacterium]NOH11054.1 HAMP domain-containing protein [Chloroflexota bacterium]